MDMNIDIDTDDKVDPIPGVEPMLKLRKDIERAEPTQHEELRDLVGLVDLVDTELAHSEELKTPNTEGVEPTQSTGQRSLDEAQESRRDEPTPPTGVEVSNPQERGRGVEMEVGFGDKVAVKFGSTDIRYRDGKNGKGCDDGVGQGEHGQDQGQDQGWGRDLVQGHDQGRGCEPSLRAERRPRGHATVSRGSRGGTHLQGGPRGPRPPGDLLATPTKDVGAEDSKPQGC